MAMFVLFLMLGGLLLPGSHSVAAEKKTFTCGSLLTLKDAAALLGVSPGDLQKSSRTMMISPDDIRKKTYKSLPCSYRIRSKSDFLKSIVYTIYLYNEPRQARMDFNRMKSHFAAVSKVDEVKGLEGKVFRARNKHLRRMIALKGTALIDVMNPADFNAQKRILRLVLEKF
jgi:hypothetical protein